MLIFLGSREHLYFQLFVFKQRTGGCICKVGFGGMDCGKVLQSSQLHFQSLDCRNASVQSRYGQTFLPHGDEGILYGGRGLESEIHSDIWSINFQNQSCEKLKPNKEPTGRYFHCGVVYKVSILQKLNCLNGFSLQARNSTFLFDLFT